MVLNGKFDGFHQGAEAGGLVSISFNFDLYLGFRVTRMLFLPFLVTVVMFGGFFFRPLYEAQISQQSKSHIAAKKNKKNDHKSQLREELHLPFSRASTVCVFSPP